MLLKAGGYYIPLNNVRELYITDGADGEKKLVIYRNTEPGDVDVEAHTINAEQTKAIQKRLDELANTN